MSTFLCILRCSHCTRSPNSCVSAGERTLMVSVCDSVYLSLHRRGRQVPLAFPLRLSPFLPLFPGQLWAGQCPPRPHRGRLTEALAVTPAPSSHSRDAYSSASAFLMTNIGSPKFRCCQLFLRTKSLLTFLSPLSSRFHSQNSDCWRQARVFLSEPTVLVLVQNPVPVTLQ